MVNSKNIAIFDLDGTLIERHLWLGIIKHHLKERKNLFRSFWYLITHLADMPLWKMKLVSTEKFYRSWGKDLSILMKGIKLEKGKEILNWVATNYLLPSAKEKTLERLREHQKQGALTILISGSFQDLVEIIAKNLNIDFALGTKLETIQNKFTGRIIPPFCFNEVKREKINNFLLEKQLKVDLKESFAYTDSIFDLPILELVGNPVVVDPDKNLLKIAQNKGWQII